jgi:hypothetical protein
MKHTITFIISILMWSCINDAQLKEHIDEKVVEDKLIGEINKNEIIQSNCEYNKEVFTFSNGNQITVCGWKNKDSSYSEFKLIDLNKNSILEDYTNDGSISAIINFKDDTLSISNLYGVPNGVKRTIQWLPFYITEYYFIKNALDKRSYYKNNLKKYNQQEIDIILANFKKHDDYIRNMDEYLKQVNELFWAYYSGSNEAELKLEKLKNYYGKHDGAISVEFDSYIITYEHYKQLSKN